MLYSLRSRLIAAFGLLLLCSSGAMSYALFYQARDMIRADIESSALEKMEEYRLYVRMALIQIYDLSSIIYNSDMTRQWDAAMSDPTLSAAEKTLASLRFSQFLTRTLYNYSGVSSITLYRTDGRWVSVENMIGEDQSFLNEAWYHDFVRSGNHWVPAHLDPIEVRRANPHQVVSLLLPIGTFEPSRADTVMKVNVSATFFSEPLEHLHLGETGAIFLLDAERRSLITREAFEALPESVRRAVRPEAPLLGGQGVLSLKDENGGAQMLVYKTLSPYDWLLVGVVSERELFAKLTRLRDAMLVLTTVLFAASIAVASWLSHGIARPLSRLASAMRHVQKGDFDKAESRLPAAGSVRNEVGFVTETFRNMVALLRHYIRTEFEQNLLRQQAEYRALLMQINPHFLFNTLELLSSLAVQRRIEDTTRVVDALGKMLRYALHGEDRVLLEEELGYIRNYISILEIRFKDRMRATVRTEGSVVGVRIPKFVLQPLVENAVKFSVASGRTAVVEVEVRREGEQLRLAVADNGPGMSEETAARLTSEPLSARLDYVLRRPAQHIGLRNTLARCGLFYGERFSFRIETEPGRGTRIELTLPVDVDEGSDDACTAS